MRCPYCKHPDQRDKVIDSRSTQSGDAVRRRRECLNCGRRFTTYETVEEVALMVVKRDGRREPFDRRKVEAGVLKAIEKRPISMEQVEQLVSEVENEIDVALDKEVSSVEVGRLVMEKLKSLDEVAYVRFASVYRQFRDINEFMNELKGLLSKEEAN